MTEYSKGNGMPLPQLGYKRLWLLSASRLSVALWLAQFADTSCHVGEEDLTAASG